MLRTVSILLLTAALLAVATLPASAQGPQNISLVLIIDNSGSMAQTDPANLRFVAASQLVDLLESGDEISVVLFANESSVLVPLSAVTDEASRQLIRSQLAPVAPSGSTNMRAGLEAGLAELEKGTNAVRFAIFLTDGQLYPPGWPSFSAAEQEAERSALFGLASSFGEREWGLFAVSLAAAVEPGFLQTLADNGGGLYREAPAAAVLTLVFQEVFAAQKLDVFEILFSDCLAPGEERSVSFPVHEFVSTLSLFVTYPDDLRPTVSVVGPDGASVSPSGGDASYDAFSIETPARGAWTVRVMGVAAGESCVAISSTPRALVEVVWLRPAASLSLGAGEPLDIAVRLTARDPQTGEERPVEDAAVSLTVSGPDEQSYAGVLGHVGAGEYEGQVAINGVEGVYSIALMAETEEGVVARRSFEAAVSAGLVATPSPIIEPTAGPTPGPTATPPPTPPGAGGGGPPLVLIFLAPALVAGLGGSSYVVYRRFGQPTLRGYLESVPGGRAYDLEARHRRRWWRRPLTIGGPEDDIDLGLGKRWARIIPRRNGECLLQAVSEGGVVVDGHPLQRGQERRLYHRSELKLGGVGLVYRLHAGGPRTGPRE